MKSYKNECVEIFDYTDNVYDGCGLPDQVLTPDSLSLVFYETIEIHCTCKLRGGETKPEIWFIPASLIAEMLKNSVMTDIGYNDHINFINKLNELTGLNLKPAKKVVFDSVGRMMSGI